MGAVWQVRSRARSRPAGPDRGRLAGAPHRRTPSIGGMAGWGSATARAGVKAAAGQAGRLHRWEAAGAAADVDVDVARRAGGRPGAGRGPLGCRGGLAAGSRAWVQDGATVKQSGGRVDGWLDLGVESRR